MLAARLEKGVSVHFFIFYSAVNILNSYFNQLSFGKKLLPFILIEEESSTILTVCSDALKIALLKFPFSPIFT